MALKRAFRAVDRASFRLWPAPAAPPLVHANDYLINAPRIYQEDIYPNYSPGVLWVSPVANAYGPTTINWIIVLAQIAWPGYELVRWRFDGQSGHYLGTDNFILGLSGKYDDMSTEPNGTLWWYGIMAQAFGGGPIMLDPTTMASATTTSPYPTTSFLDKHGSAVSEWMVAAFDRNADRVFVRWGTNLVGEVSIYKLSTREYLATIYTPNDTIGIVLTGDTAYLVDSADWICIYSYDGSFQGALRNPRRVNYHVAGRLRDFALGWDQFYKRLLFAPATPNAADGACKMRIWGYYPVPDAAGVTPPIPRQVPRAGRRVYVFSRAYGEGGEPLAARSATATGTDVGSAVTDRDGDAIIAATPSAAGSLGVSLTVDVDTTPADAAETDPDPVAGRTLLLTLEQPCTATSTTSVEYSPGSIPCQVTIGANGVSPYTAVFSFNTGPGQVEVTVSGAGPTLTTTVTLTAQTWNVAVLVTDAAGNHGQASNAGGIWVH